MGTTSARHFIGTIEPFVPSHLPDIQAFWVESWVRTMPAIDFAARRDWLGDHLTALAARGVAIRVAVADDGTLAGFVTVDPSDGHLDQICVAPTWWGGGVAEALLEDARGLSPDRLVLDVNADNPRAIAFYVRSGFVETARAVNPRSGLPIVRMQWTRR